MALGFGKGLKMAEDVAWLRFDFWLPLKNTTRRPSKKSMVLNLAQIHFFCDVRQTVPN